MGKVIGVFTRNRWGVEGVLKQLMDQYHYVVSFLTISPTEMSLVLSNGNTIVWKEITPVGRWAGSHVDCALTDRNLDDEIIKGVVLPLSNYSKTIMEWYDGGFELADFVEKFIKEAYVAERSRQLEEAAKPLITFINKWGNPYSIVTVEQGRVNMYSGETTVAFDVPD